MATTLAGSCPQAVPLACVVALPLGVLALFLGRLARPNESRFDCGSQLTPLVVGLGGVCAGGGLRSAGRPAHGGLALGAVVPLSSFATIVLRGRALWGGTSGALRRRASVIEAWVKG